MESMDASPLVFLLSPAHCGGKRAGYLLNPQATFETAVRLRAGGLSIADVFSFLSGLYFRGKVAYARRFAAPPIGLCGAYVITTNRGLLPMDTKLSVDDLRRLGCASIDAENAAYAKPLVRDIQTLAAVNDRTQFVLLGSVATGKYVDLLGGALGQRLLFPVEFVGRGDMSRGGLMLRHARSGEPLQYAPVLDAVRKGKRPAKLKPVPGILSAVET